MIRKQIDIKKINYNIHKKLTLIFKSGNTELLRFKSHTLNK